MSETRNASAAAGIDLSQFHQVFFEEAGENLQQMEQLLLDIDLESAEDEALNAIFRCAHSLKGGAATFGFADVAELTHQMETLLDKLRRHELALSSPMVDVLLQAGDALKLQLARHQGRRRRAGHHRTAGARARAGRPGRRCAPGAPITPIRRHGRGAGRDAAALAGADDRPAAGHRCRGPRGRTLRRDRRPGHDRAAAGRRRQRRRAPLQGVHRLQRRRAGRPVVLPCRQRAGAAGAAGGRRTGPGHGGAGAARHASASGQRRRGHPARVGRQGRPADQPGGRTGHRPGHAGAEQRVAGAGGAAAAVGRAGRPAAPHAPSAGIGDVDPHDSDVGGVQPLPAPAARPGGQAGQEGRAGDARRGHRAGQGHDREDHRPADAPGAQQLRPRHRDAGRAAGARQAGDGDDHAGGVAPGRLDRHRGARRRQGPVARQAAGQGARARPARAATA